MTITEIAQAAGVSIATVSRYLNNGPVKEETQKKIESIILKLNYIPESMVHKIVNTPKKAVALITHSLTNYYTMEFARKIEEEYTKRNYSFYLCNRSGAISEYNYLIDLISRGIDGIIIHEPTLAESGENIYRQISEKHVPLVMIHSFQTDYSYNSITVNQSIGMSKAMDYMINNNFKRIAFIRGDESFSFDIKEKIWREKLKGNNLSVLEQDCLTVSSPDNEDGILNAYNTVTEYLKAGNKPSIFFTCNDIIALGTYQAIKDFGLSVPNDIAIMSHDNTVLAKTMNFSCVDMMISSAAECAIDLLDYASNGKVSPPRHISISPELIIRESTRK